MLGTNSPLPLKKVNLNDTKSGPAEMSKALLKINLCTVFGRPLGKKRKEEAPKR
jgi:hypothetical protein